MKTAITEDGERIPPIDGDKPCKEYDPAGPGAGVEPDGFPQCAICGFAKSSHQLPTLTRDEKRALVAKRLPELLEIGDATLGVHRYYWRGNPNVAPQPVTEREWLSVMHEAEKTLTFEQQTKYAGELLQVVTRDARKLSERHVWRATADQRLTAFLAVVGTGERA